MGVKIYHGKKYLYTTVVDEHGNEYMTYGEYLFIKDKVPGWAMFFELPPIVHNNKLLKFEMKSVKVKRVEKLNDKLFIIYTRAKDYTKSILTSGETFAWVSNDVINFLKKNFDPKKLELLVNYEHTNASYILKYGNKFVVVYDDLFLKVDPRTLEINNDENRRHVIRVIDFGTNPTTEKIYEIDNGVVKYYGRRYTEYVPIYNYAPSKNRIKVQSPIKEDKIIMKKGKRIKIITSLNPIFGFNSFRKDKRIDEKKIPHRFNEIYWKYNPIDNTVKSIFEWRGKVYFGEIPLNAYIVGNREYIVKNFARQLPFKIVNGELYIDYSLFKKFKNSKQNAVYKIMGYDVVDQDYALVMKTDRGTLILPLIENDITTGKRVFAMTVDAYRWLKGDPGKEKLDGFYVYKYEVNYSTIGSGSYSENRVWGSEVMKFKGYYLPKNKNVEKIVSKLGDYIKSVHYVPSRDDYAIVFELSEGYVVLVKWIYVIFIPKGIDFGFELDDDLEKIEDFNVEVSLEKKYSASRHYSGYADYFEIEVQNNEISTRFVGGRWRSSRNSKIFFPIRKPSYIYKDCKIFMGIGDRPVMLVRELCLPEGLIVKNIIVTSEQIDLKVEIERTGEVFDIIVYDDGVVNIEQNNKLLTELNDENDLYPLLEVVSRVGLKSGLSML